MRTVILIVAVLLLVAGAFGVIRGGISIVTDRESAEIGPVDVTVNEKEHLPISPALGVLLLVGGGLLLVARNRVAR